MRAREPSKLRFTMIDILAAMVVLSVLSSMVILSLRASRSLERKCAAKHQALLVIDNTLERFDAAADKSLARLTTLFGDEFAKSGWNDNFHHVRCRLDGDAVDLSITSGADTLANVRIPCAAERKE